MMICAPLAKSPKRRITTAQGHRDNRGLIIFKAQAAGFRQNRVVGRKAGMLVAKLWFRGTYS